MVAFPPFRLDVVNQCVWRGDARLSLKPKPFAVLQYLVAHAGRLISQDELLAAVWPDTYVQSEVLRQYILEIRRTLGDRPDDPHYIRTYPKRGYEFIAPIRDETPTRPSGREDGSERLVGRSTVLADLNVGLANAEAGRRQIVFVTGEAGIGKSSVMDAVQHRAAAKVGVRVARGQALEGFGGKEAYYPLFEALGQLASGPAGMPVVRILQRHAPTWLIQFPSLVASDERAALRREILGATRDRMVRELCEALEVMSEITTHVLILEDLHWADHSTLDVLSALARRRETARLFVLGTFRPADVIVAQSPLKTLKQDLVVHRLACELALERLQRSDIADYLASRLHPGDIPDALADVILRHSDGNPFFMTAMLDHLVQQEVLSRVDGRWRISGSIADLDPGVPETLKQMLEMQLSHLTAAQRRLLAAASVCGQQFTAWAVAATLQLDTAAVETECETLTARQQFLRTRGVRQMPDGTSTSELTFRHALYRDVLYLGLNPVDRANLHRRLATELERLQSPVDPETAGELALHWERGADFDKAISYLLMAATKARRRFAHRESMSMLEHAYALAPKATIDRRRGFEVQILRQSGDAQYAVGDMVASARMYEAMAAKCAEGGMPNEADALMLLTRPTALIDPDRCVNACERAARLAAATGDPVLEARSMLLVACWRLLMRGWRREYAADHAAAIARLREHGGELPPYDRIIHASVQRLQGEYQMAVENADRAIAALTEGDGLWETASALSVKGFALAHLGQLGAAYDALTRATVCAAKNENIQWLSILRTNLALVHWQACDYEGLRALTTDLMQSCRATPLAQTWLPRILTFDAFADLGLGDAHLALQKSREADQVQPHRTVLHWYWRLFTRLAISEAALACGDLTTARAEADALIRSLGDFDAAFLLATAWELHARVALSGGDTSGAREHIGRAIAIVDRSSVPLAAWRVHATAWDVYRPKRQEAERHRVRATAIVRRIAASLEGHKGLLDSLLNDPRVRRIVDKTKTASRHATRARARSDRAEI